jgi:mRNA-degrading endonuclease RelE of RelBE toxin-antitoxin system
MRTTLTIDADVAAELERLRRARNKKFKDLVNEALRRGLRELAAPPKKQKPFRTRSMDLGRCLIDNLDNIAEVLAIAEGEDFR